MKAFCSLVAFLLIVDSRAADFDPAAGATNQFAVDLHRQFIGEENLCISPYPIRSALAMTFTGADGETRSEMARVLNALPVVGNRLRRGAVHLDLRAHLLQACSNRFNLLLLLRHRRF
jgi:serine protease inhibitor